MIGKIILKELLTLIPLVMMIFPFLAVRGEVVSYESAESEFSEAEEEASEDGEEDVLKGVWVSQFDMSILYRNGGKQREKSDYTERVFKLLHKIRSDGYNTLFLQVRPNGDSMYESEIYPNSKYVAGVYGGEMDYDAVGIFVDAAKELKLSVHAWINPFRLESGEEIERLNDGERVKELYKKGVAKAGGDGLYYLDPSYEETVDIIVDGADEILDKYDFDGIHIDDYFYPTEFELDDEDEFLKSGRADKGEFRRENISRTVKALYGVCHAHGKIFGVSPAGNIYSLENGWYVDIYEWLSQGGYVDYVMPQLYFGFKNRVCPFDKILEDWENAVKNENIKLYIGISAAKCCLGSEGVADAFAGDGGKYEWRDEKNVIARQIELVYGGKAKGFCMFSCSSLIDMETLEDNALLAEEKKHFEGLIK